MLSIDAHTPKLKALSVQVGRKSQFGMQVLNRSLDNIAARSAQDQLWLEKLIPKHPSGDRKALVDLLCSIPTKNYQWTKKHGLNVSQHAKCSH